MTANSSCFLFLFIRCQEGTCAAAFTTKQCLQFHYKKVHGFTDNRMPRIERSVAYTFDAYAGEIRPNSVDSSSSSSVSISGNIKSNNNSKLKSFLLNLSFCHLSGICSLIYQTHSLVYISLLGQKQNN